MNIASGNELPANYKCVAYKEQLATWRFLDDIFNGAETWLGRDESGSLKPTAKARVYLPQEAAENDGDYIKRLARSPYNDFFAQAIRKFINLIFANPLTFSPEFQHSGSLDNHGATAEALLRGVATQVMRSGHSFVLVDFPPTDPSIITRADQLASGRRPYWVHYSPLDVLNWRTVTVNGVIQLSQVTLRERVTVPAGRFGEETIEQYRVLVSGGWELYQMQKDERGRETVVQVDGNETTLNYIPLVCIYADDTLKEGWFKSRPPLFSLAELNKTHYQVKSDHLRKVHMCCMPIPELRDSMRPDGEKLVLGPTSFIHIRDPNGAFNWREPLATSIIESRREVQDLEAAADILSASYLTQPADRQSAMATLAQSAVVESSLQGFVSSFTAGVNRCLEIHADYLKRQPSQILLSSEVLRDKGTDSQLLLALINFATTLNTLRPSVALLLLRLMKLNFYLPAEFDVEAEAVKLGTPTV